MVYYGVNKITSSRQAMELLPQVHWSIRRVNTLHRYMGAEDEYEVSVVNLIPRYKRIRRAN